MRGGAPGRSEIFWILVGASILTSLGSVPYLVALLEQMPGPGGRPFETRGAFPYLVTAVQNLVLTIPTAWVGLRLARGAGFAVMKPPLGRAVQAGVWGGLAVGAGLILLAPLLPEIAPKFPLKPAEWWKGLLASASAGVNEEIWFRLGVMTALVAGGMALLRRGARKRAPEGDVDVDVDEVGSMTAGGTEAPPVDTGEVAVPPGLLWVANAIAALLFGALHLPQASMIAGLSPPVVAFTLIGNGIAAMAFGVLYWKHGLLSAMVAHFSTDIVLHVIAPLAGA
jgi:hypothetical protein